MGRLCYYIILTQTSKYFLKSFNNLLTTFWNIIYLILYIPILSQEWTINLCLKNQIISLKSRYNRILLYGLVQIQLWTKYISTFTIILHKWNENYFPGQSLKIFTLRVKLSNSIFFLLGLSPIVKLI